MPIIVQKFGGTSLSSAQARSRVIHHIERELHQSHQVVVVVSAMGRAGEPYATDTLLGVVEQNGGILPARERDLLLGCGEIISATNLCSLLTARGISAAVLTGGQAGILTNDRFGDARIISVSPSRILSHLEAMRVVIVTGFQGWTASGEMTTLGRGGSDTSAAALGVALNAACVDIFTDVSGVYTADPRIARNARPLDRITYAEISQMAQSGAKVIHPRAVEIAMAARIPLRVRSTFADDEGTWVGQGGAPADMSSRIRDSAVTGIACVSGVSQLEVRTPEPKFDLHFEVFRLMAENRISVDFVNMNPTGVVYTVYDFDRHQAVSVLRANGYEPQVKSGCAKVSVIGGGMNGVPGIMAKIAETLTGHDIAILQAADSNTTIWVLVDEVHAEEAVNALHDAFQLGTI